MGQYSLQQTRVDLFIDLISRLCQRGFNPYRFRGVLEEPVVTRETRPPISEPWLQILRANAPVAADSAQYDPGISTRHFGAYGADLVHEPDLHAHSAVHRNFGQLCITTTHPLHRSTVRTKTAIDFFKAHPGPPV